MNKPLIINGCVVEVTRGNHWTKDKIYIYDPCLHLEEEDVHRIIEYLYTEGFIEDRKTLYRVVRIED